MYSINDTTIRTKVFAALAEPSREFSNRITFGYYDTSQSKPYPFVAQHVVCELAECSIEQSANAGEKLTMGGAFAASLNATFTAREADTGTATTDKTVSTPNFITSYAYKNKIAFVECGIKYDYDAENDKDLFYYIPCGYFVVTEAESENEWKTVKITGYDYLGSVMDDPKNPYNIAVGTYYVQYNTSTYNMVRTIAMANGIDYSYNYNSIWYYWNKQGSTYAYRQLSSDEQNSFKGLTWREALNRMCALVGCAARINTAGKLIVDFFSVPGDYYDRITIKQNQQYQDGFKKLADNPFTISSITSTNNGTGNDKTYTAGTGAGLSFANPIITNNDIDGILIGLQEYSNRASAYNITSFMPCEVLWRGNPCVEAGDVVTVQYKGTSYKVFVAKQVTDLVGGLSQKITCPVADEEVRFDTGDWVTEQELARNITDVRQALATAIESINGSQGGYIQINDTDDPPDGNPDEILITAVEGGATGEIVKLNKMGILIGTGGINGSFNVAITGSGINATAINTGILNADLIQSGSINASLITSGVLNGEIIQSGSITADKMDIGGLVDNDLPDFSFLSGAERKSRWSAAIQYDSISYVPEAQWCYNESYDNQKAYYFKITNSGGGYNPRNYWADLLIDCPEGSIGGDCCLAFTPFVDGDTFEGGNILKVTLYAISDANKQNNESRFSGLPVTKTDTEQCTSNLTKTYTSSRVRYITSKLKEIEIGADDLGKKQRIRFTLPQISLLDHEYFLISVDLNATGTTGTSYYGLKELGIGNYVEGETVVAGTLKSYTEETYFDLDEAQICLTDPKYKVINDADQEQTLIDYQSIKFTKEGNNANYGLYSECGVELYDYAANGTKNGYLSFAGPTHKGIALASTGTTGGNIVIGGSYSPSRTRSFDYYKFNPEYSGGETVSGNIYAEFYEGDFTVNCDTYIWGIADFKNNVVFDNNTRIYCNGEMFFNDFPTFNATATFNYGIKSDSIMVDNGNYTALLYQSNTIFLGNSNKSVQIDASTFYAPAIIYLGGRKLEAKSDGLYYGDNRLCYYAERNNP